ncbi:dihydrolipoamide acetyltransferase family protein [Aliicoccus persicus]|uniref:Dihydrolipoamide acetyltransferase component of pyruvate dehydrogenase complex n=1 Tax=Aliicoccus persicus TaxID=930138 RepID=A0A662Z1X5_9STAP|nr:dihydrolipoamide acetyltransferase family protein [Aliicoccus persicus]SEV91713.1 pyruvate dehydrogenase E2 component (dihydrolipoamide acetyltransferase) [Aliicoccus persicus]
MVEVKLHDIGEGMTEGTIVSYFAREGDEVKRDQPIIELQTEKMVTELSAPVAGKISKIHIEEGQTIPVGTTILEIEAADNVNNEPENKNIEEVDNKQSTTTGPKRIKAAPFTRKVARELGVDIDAITGTGKDGRITVKDVESFSNGGTQIEEKQTSSTQEDVEFIPFKGRRKQIAAHMTKSLFTIPHVAHMEEIDMTKLLAYREDIKETYNISVAAFFIKALAMSLKKFPIFNAELDEDNSQIKLKPNVNMGVAVDTKEGLIVPVINRVEDKSLGTIHSELKTLNEKARENTLQPQDVRGSTFTISNVGPMGSIGATPIINYPEVALMCFHKTKKMPVVNEADEIVIRSMMNVTLTFDHRVMDGGDAIQFTNYFKSLIENPNIMLVELSGE